MVKCDKTVGRRHQISKYDQRDDESPEVLVGSLTTLQARSLIGRKLGLGWGVANS